MAHELKVSSRARTLLDAAARETDRLSEDDPGRALVRVARREHDRASRLPEAFVAELKEHLASSYVAWAKARPESDFDAVRPYLEKTIELSRRYSAHFPDAADVADPLIDEMDPGLTTARVTALFGELRSALVSLVQAIGRAPAPDDAFLRRGYEQEGQLAFARSVIERIGYDFDRGRLDLTHHPFMTKFSLGDVRITTRVRADDLTDALFSTIHECGHALYEQGIDRSFEGTPLGAGVSAGVHESQSRLWENVVGRSRPFWRFFLPLAKEAFPAQLADVDLDAFHRAINKVEPSLIRVDADEVTYNLHVMIRFDLAAAMLSGDLPAKDLPDAWNARYESDLGVRPPDHRRGCMQDVHWYCEKIGGLFQGYTIGNVLSAQIHRAAVTARPEIPDRIAAGDFVLLLAWLRENVHRHGSVMTPDALVARATGGPLSVEPFVTYLRDKYGALYNL